MSFLNGNQSEDDAIDTEVKPDRLRRLTEKGRLQQLELIDKKRKNVTKRIDKQRQLMDVLMNSENNVECVADELSVLNEVFKDLISLNQRYEAIEIQEDEFDNWFDEADKEMLAFKLKCHAWMKIARDNIECKTNSSRRSKTSFKSRRSCSSAASIRSTKEIVRDEVAKVAELKVEAANLDQQ